MDADEPQLRHLRDILGAYARQILGWYSIADDRDDAEDDEGGHHPKGGVAEGGVQPAEEQDARSAAKPHHSVARAFRWTRLTLSVSVGVEGFWERLAGGGSVGRTYPRQREDCGWDIH